MDVFLFFCFFFTALICGCCLFSSCFGCSVVNSCKAPHSFSCPHIWASLIRFSSMWGDVLFYYSLKPSSCEQLEHKKVWVCRETRSQPALVIILSGVMKCLTLSLSLLLGLPLFLCQVVQSVKAGRQWAPTSTSSSPVSISLLWRNQGHSVCAAAAERWLTATLKLSEKSDLRDITVRFAGG